MSPSAVTCARQQFIDSAKPCSSSTSGAPDTPDVSASKVRCGAIVICSRTGMRPSWARLSGMAIPPDPWRNGFRWLGAELCNARKVLYWEAANRRKPGETSLHYLRSILFIAAVGTLTIVVSLSVPFMWLFNAGSPTVRAVSQVWARGIMLLFRIVLGLDYREYGREHIPDGACIIACNHQSLWETAALSMIFPDASIVAKKELSKLPIVGWFLLRYPMILVDRAAGRQALKQMVEEAKRAVAEGRKVLLFPQGTRQA